MVCIDRPLSRIGHLLLSLPDTHTHTHTHTHTITHTQTHHWKEQTKISKWTNHRSIGSAINLKNEVIIRFCMADELNRHVLPVHHTKPYKNSNFQDDGTSRTLVSDSENWCIY